MSRKRTLPAASGVSAAVELRGRFLAHVRERGLLPSSGTVVVAVSGGRDSVVLLHLLRFQPALSALELVVAHFDHALREDSAADAAWVRGLSRAWGLGCEQERAARPPRGEARARRLRYAFLEAVRSAAGATCVLTAHHADDQAETVLFRVLRGTGIGGLRGIAERRQSVVRPLLPFWRSELLEYARAERLASRLDPSNLDLGLARNALRHDILPRAEAAVASGARRALVRLARHAEASERAWEALASQFVHDVVEDTADGRVVLVRSRWLAYDPAIRARLLRLAAGRLGADLSEAGTRLAMEFSSRGGSGREIRLPGAVRLRRNFDRLEFSPLARTAPAPDCPLELASPARGTGVAVVGGRALRVCWGPSPTGAAAQVAVDAGGVAFPLTFRSWRPGDRIRLGYGSKTVSKLLAEARVPSDERTRVPVLTDAGNRVLWVLGVARALGAGADEETLYIGVEDAEGT